MQNRGTIALIALLFAGLVGLWLADRAQTPSAVERARQRGRILTGLVDLRPDDLRKIEIEGKSGSDQPALIFERRGRRKWQMTAPLDVAANPSLVEGLAFRLKELTRKPEAATLTEDPNRYGLTPPAHTIRLWGAATDAPLATLELGDVNLDRRFVRTGDAGIEVVPAEGLEVVDLPPIRWRDRDLFRVPTFEVDAVTLQRPERDLQFLRGRDAWRIVAPIQALAEEKQLEGLVANLGGLRIIEDEQFVADNVPATDRARYGLDQPSLRVTVTSGRGDNPRPNQTMEVGKAVAGQPGRLYARMTDQNDVVALDARVLNELIQAEPNDFRQSRVADINPNRATRFRVEASGNSFEVARLGNAWFLTRPSVGRADTKAVQEFFQALEGLRTTLYLPPSGQTEQLAGLEHPSEIIQVWQDPDPRAPRLMPAPGSASTGATEGEPPALTLKLGNRDAGKKIVYAQAGGDTSILALPDGMTDNLFRTSWAFRDRLFLAVPTEQIERIQIEGLGKQVTLQAPVLKLDLVKNAAAGWWMTEPVAAQADREAVSQLLKLLTAFRVDGYAAEAPPSLQPFGLDQPTLKVTWSVPAAPPFAPLLAPPASIPATGKIPMDDQTLLIGGPVAERRGMRYAKLADKPVVFMLGGATLATLDAEWHTHQVSKFDPGAIVRVHLTWPGSSWAVDLVRSDGAWSVVGPVDIPGLDPTATDSVIQAASRLTTSRFLQYRGEIPATIGLTPPRVVAEFAGPTIATPVQLALGDPIDPRQSYAATPDQRPGAVFLVDFAPFLPWLQIQAPPPTAELPADVWHRDPPPTLGPAAIGRAGQTDAQPR